MRNWGIIVLCLALTGCSTPRTETAQDPRAKMVGMQQEQVIACMGAPVQRALESDGEVWHYSSESGKGATSASTALNGSNFSSRLCDVNIVFSKGQVSAVKFTGPLDGAAGSADQCTSAISPCVKQRDGHDKTPSAAR